MTEPTWRVGRKQPRNLYIGDEMVGVMIGTPEEAAKLAAAVVSAMNGPPTHYITGSGSVTECCRRTPFELPHADRLTDEPEKATCPGPRRMS